MQAVYNDVQVCIALSGCDESKSEFAGRARILVAGKVLSGICISIFEAEELEFGLPNGEYVVKAWLRNPSRVVWGLSQSVFSVVPEEHVVAPGPVLETFNIEVDLNSAKIVVHANDDIRDVAEGFCLANGM